MSRKRYPQICSAIDSHNGLGRITSPPLGVVWLKEILSDCFYCDPVPKWTSGVNIHRLVRSDFLCRKMTGVPVDLIELNPIWKIQLRLDEDAMTRC